jgi:signal transduction histidine kinase
MPPSAVATRTTSHAAQGASFDPVLALATADDLASGLAEVAEQTRIASGAAGVEWWSNGADGLQDLAASTGAPRGVRRSVRLGDTGVVVLHGGRLDACVKSALASLEPIIRRRAAEERLATFAVGLARRNQALEDFGALVAHELKTPLHVALVADDPRRSVEEAMGLVDSLLEAAQTEPAERTFASVEASLAEAIADLDADVHVTSDLETPIPLPPAQLRTILRNLVSNAISAGARNVHVTSARTRCSWRLLVDDDGVGLAHEDGYASGSGLGLSLCRRIAERFGGVLKLAPRPSGGTRATVEFAEALR